MEKTKEELLNYALKMYLRGETFRSIMGYLERNTSDQETVKQIIASLDKFEKENKIERHKEKDRPSTINLIMGIIFIAGGAWLTYYLWGRGFVAILPLLLIITGLFAISRR